MDFPLSSMEVVFSPERWVDAYQWKSLGDAGAKIAYASDWPVTDVSVMRGIQAALTRVPFKGGRDERLGLMETLYAYTAGGAWAAHMERQIGMLRPGMAADLVLIDGDIESIPAPSIGATGIALTIAGGRVSYQSESVT